MNKNLTYTLRGCDHNQELHLEFCGLTIFDGIADNLVTSISGNLQMRLNYKDNKNHLHTLKINNGLIVFIPEIPDLEVVDYLVASEASIPICTPLKLMALWSTLRYDPKEIDMLPQATQSDLFLLWLLSSGTKSLHSIKLKSLTNTLKRNIIAENIEGSPSVHNTIQNLVNNQKSLKLIYNKNLSNDKSITAFIDENNNEVSEWKALNADRTCCLLKNNYALELI